MKYLIVLLSFCFLQNVQANLIVNEVLSNEPGSATSLEWIELYNSSDSSLLLSDYTLVVNSISIILPSQVVQGDSYLILCKKLYAPIEESCFENYWGNGSHLWGDTEYESTLAEPIEASFSLLNDSGVIQLLQQQNIISTFEWHNKGEDGVSWERKYIDSTIIQQSKSKQLATPGYINSISFVQTDLAIEAISTKMINFIPYYTFLISNRGFTDIDDGKLLIYDSLLFLLNTFDIPQVLSDSTIEVEISFELPRSSSYTTLHAIADASSDMRISNDTLTFVAVSSGFPPLIISEFLANPQGVHKTEWIEIYNRSTEPLNLQDWYIGDALKIYPISLDQSLIPVEEYMILTKSKTDFLFEYPNYTGFILEMDNWAILNNESDKIRLFDKYSIEADSYYYDKLYTDNYTLMRDILNGTFQWGRSSEPFGTPGYENEMFQISNNIKINLSSKYISPDGDGYEDDISIEVEVPISESYTLKLYDINGNIVKTLFSKEEYISNKTVWNGLDDNNEKLPVGIYILYLSTDEGNSVKETIVIAR